VSESDGPNIQFAPLTLKCIRACSRPSLFLYAYDIPL